MYYTQTGIVSSVTVRHGGLAVILTIIMLMQFLYYTQTSIVSSVTLSTQCMQAGDAEHRVIPSVERVPKESDGEIRKLQSQIHALKLDVEHHRITVSAMQPGSFTESWCRGHACKIERAYYFKVDLGL